MKIFKETQKLKEELRSISDKKLSHGFVPTMGALHEGHLSLVQSCRTENDICVVSIFVNPLQFNNADDLKNYPQSLEQDKKLLEQSDCDILFVPSVEEIYSIEQNFDYELGHMEKVMEGLYRPGHLKGMLTIVKRFLDIVRPKRAYFGEKDYQQLSAVNKMVKDLNLDVGIIGVPTKREENGLAMSSRNILLSEDEREEACIIHKVLSYARRNTDRHSVLELKQECEKMLEDRKIKLEYFEIADSNSLENIQDWKEAKQARAFIAAYLGKVRLIDNMSLID